VGHILFTPAVIESKRKQIKGMGLAPMAVIPAYQNKGIGSKLVMAGLEKMKQLNIPFVIVLGHPTYYPKFGFGLASSYGIMCGYDGVPDEAFMILILNKDKMKNLKGVAKYRPEFAAAV
jgi:putative acetyltransferase